MTELGELSDEASVEARLERLAPLLLGPKERTSVINAVDRFRFTLGQNSPDAAKTALAHLLHAECNAGLMTRPELRRKLAELGSNSPTTSSSPPSSPAEPAASTNGTFHDLPAKTALVYYSRETGLVVLGTDAVYQEVQAGLKKLGFRHWSRPDMGVPAWLARGTRNDGWHRDTVERKAAAAQRELQRLLQPRGYLVETDLSSQRFSSSATDTATTPPPRKQIVKGNELELALARAYEELETAHRRLRTDYRYTLDRYDFSMSASEIEGAAAGVELPTAEQILALLQVGTAIHVKRIFGPGQELNLGTRVIDERTDSAVHLNITRLAQSFEQTMSMPGAHDVEVVSPFRLRVLKEGKASAEITLVKPDSLAEMVDVEAKYASSERNYEHHRTQLLDAVANGMPAWGEEHFREGDIVSFDGGSGHVRTIYSGSVVLRLSSPSTGPRSTRDVEYRRVRAIRRLTADGTIDITSPPTVPARIRQLAREAERPDEVFDRPPAIEQVVRPTPQQPVATQPAAPATPTRVRVTLSGPEIEKQLAERRYNLAALMERCTEIEGMRPFDNNFASIRSQLKPGAVLAGYRHGGPNRPGASLGARAIVKVQTNAIAIEPLPQSNGALSWWQFPHAGDIRTEGPSTFTQYDHNRPLLTYTLRRPLLDPKHAFAAPIAAELLKVAKLESQLTELISSGAYLPWGPEHFVANDRVAGPQRHAATVIQARGQALEVRRDGRGITTWPYYTITERLPYGSNTVETRPTLAGFRLQALVERMAFERTSGKSPVADPSPTVIATSPGSGDAPIPDVEADLFSSAAAEPAPSSKSGAETPRGITESPSPEQDGLFDMAPTPRAGAERGRRVRETALVRSGSEGPTL